MPRPSHTPPSLASQNGSNKRKEPDHEEGPKDGASEDQVVGARRINTSRLAKRTPRDAQVHPPTPPPFLGSGDDEDEAPEAVDMVRG